MSFLSPKRMLLTATAAVALVSVVQAAEISGAGATFPTPLTTHKRLAAYGRSPYKREPLRHSHATPPYCVCAECPKPLN